MHPTLERALSRFTIASLLQRDAQPRVTAGVFLVATLLRLHFNLSAHPLEDHVFSDMAVYDLRAERLLTRHFDAWDTFTPVGYPAFLALVFRLAGTHSLAAVAAAQAIIGGATCAVAHRLALRVTLSPWVALLTSIVLVVYVPLILYGGLLLTEGPAALLVTLSCLLVLRAVEAPTTARLSAAGLVLGVAATVRPNLLLAYPFLFLHAWAAAGRSWRSGARLAGQVIAWSAPILLAAGIHNSRILGRPAGLGTNGGLNFFLAHAEVSGATYDDGVTTHRIGPLPNVVRYGEVFVSSEPLYEEGYFYRKGVRQLGEDPWRLLSALDNVAEGVGLGRQDFWPGWPGHDRLLVFSSKAMFWLGILPMALHGLVLAALGRLLTREGASRALLFGFVMSSMLTLYAFLGDPRVRVPFDAIILVLAIDGWVRGLSGLESLRGRRADATTRATDLAEVQDPALRR